MKIGHHSVLTKKHHLNKNSKKSIACRQRPCLGSLYFQRKAVCILKFFATEKRKDGSSQLSVQEVVWGFRERTTGYLSTLSPWSGPALKALQILPKWTHGWWLWAECGQSNIKQNPLETAEMAFLSYCTTCYTFAKHSVIPKANISPTISFIEVFTAYFTAPVSNRMTSVTLWSPPCIPHNSEFHWQKKVVRKLLCHVIFLSYKRCYLRISAMRFLDGLTLVTPRKDVLLSGVWPELYSHEGFNLLSFLAGRVHWCRLGGGGK